MSPSWYDLLGVSPSASSEEIRAAWKESIADLDPTDRRFRVLNEAAEVLLDPERRAEHDRDLIPQPAPEPPPTRQTLTGGAERGTSISDVSGETPGKQEARQASEAKERSRTTSVTKETLEPGTGASLPAPRRGIPSWVLAAVAALTAVMVVLAAWLYNQPSDAAVRDATSEAQGAAERAIVTILAYDYRTLDEDEAAAKSLMTAEYRKKYEQFFSLIRDNAPSTKSVVTVEPVVASGIVRSGDERVQVLVFINRPTTNAESPEPRIFRDQVTLTMEKVGDDWLVDNLVTGPPEG